MKKILIILDLMSQSGKQLRWENNSLSYQTSLRVSSGLLLRLCVPGIIIKGISDCFILIYYVLLQSSSYLRSVFSFKVIKMSLSNRAYIFFSVLNKLVLTKYSTCRQNLSQYLNYCNYILHTYRSRRLFKKSKMKIIQKC